MIVETTKKLCQNVKVGWIYKKIVRQEVEVWSTEMDIMKSCAGKSSREKYERRRENR